MPRRARLSIPGIPWHIIQRGNNRSVCFFVIIGDRLEQKVPSTGFWLPFGKPVPGPFLVNTPLDSALANSS
jgi:REP element-mobilizing transposase RayT